MDLKLSEATEADVDVLYELTVALAVYEKKTPDQILVTKEKLRKCGFGPQRTFQALIARVDEKPVGLAVYYYGYSGYVGSSILYLEDLFVLPDSRGRGIGTAMLRMLARRALQADCCRMQWAVFDWNQEAIEFYRSIGAKLRPDLVQVRLEVGHFSELTSGAKDDDCLSNR